MLFTIIISVFGGACAGILLAGLLAAAKDSEDNPDSLRLNTLESKHMGLVYIDGTWATLCGDSGVRVIARGTSLRETLDKSAEVSHG